MIPRETIDDILRRLDIVDVIQRYVPLTRKGKNFVGLCPFHEDGNPSLSVSREKQIFKCFSCGTAWQRNSGAALYAETLGLAEATSSKLYRYGMS